MNSTLAIAQRELIEKRFVLVAAAAFLALALVIPFMPGVRPEERGGALGIGSLLLATVFAFGLAAILGSTIVGREMSDGRLSFYFTKPVAATSIWWGKLIASVALIAVCFFMILTPAFLAGGMTTINRWINTPAEMLSFVLKVLALAAGLFLLAHVVGTFVRSRSAWFLLDFVAATLSFTLYWILSRQLILGYADELFLDVGILLLSFLAAAVIAAGAWQMARGRTDRRRSHMELSRFLWTCVAAALLLYGGYIYILVTTPVSQMSNVEVVQSSLGSWSLISGRSLRGNYRSSFLYDASDRRSIRLPAVRPWDFRFAPDGKSAAWLSVYQLYTADLHEAMPHPTHTRIMAHTLEALSDDGSRVVLRAGNLITIYDVRSQRSLGSALIHSAAAQVRFLTPDTIRVYCGDDLSILEFDLTTKSVRRAGRVPGLFLPSSDNTRGIVYREHSEPEVVEAGTGMVIARIAATRALILRDGRIAAVEDREHATALFRLLNRDGVPLREFALPEPSGRWLHLTESGDGIVVVQLQRHSAVVDVNRGVVRSDEAMFCSASHAGAWLICYSQQCLVVWNPTTGQKRPVT